MIFKTCHLVCDFPDCHEEFDGSTPGADELWAHAQAGGWTERGRRHYCPKHPTSAGDHKDSELNIS